MMPGEVGDADVVSPAPSVMAGARDSTPSFATFPIELSSSVGQSISS
jgi:hypothetical protein